MRAIRSAIIEHGAAAVASAFLALAALSLTGCQSGEVLGPVTGKVTFQGRPVTEGIIIFSNSQTGVHMTADLDENGTFVVDMAKGYGLPLGTYEVSLSPPLVDLPLGPALSPPSIKPYPNIPEKYRDPKTSGLTLTVQKGENVFDVEMKP